MSLGARFQSDAEDVQGTLISNPIMGHIKSNLYKKLSDNLRLATQYDINVYSLHSDVSFGGEYRIPDGGQSIKCKASLQHGIGINLLSRFDWGLLTMGFNLGRTSPTQWGISLEFF